MPLGSRMFVQVNTFPIMKNTTKSGRLLCKRLLTWQHPRRSIDFCQKLILLSVKNRLDEVKFRCFPVKRTLRRQECSPRRSGDERTVYLSCSTKRFPPSCCFASRRQRSNETDAGRPVQRKLLAAGPANRTGGSRNRHGGDWLPGRPQGEGFRNPESGFCDRCGDVLRV